MSRVLRSRLASAALAVGLLGGTAVSATLVAPVATAHSVLLSVEPADGATVETAPDEVVLTFNEEVNQSFATVAVTGEDNSGNRASGEPEVDGPNVTAAVDELDPGLYTVGYRVTSADGHVISGSSTFTVEAGAGAGSGSGSGEDATTSDAAGADASDTPATAADDPAETSDQSTTGMSTALWVVGGLAVVLVGGAIWMLLRRGKN